MAVYSCLIRTDENRAMTSASSPPPLASRPEAQSRADAAFQVRARRSSLAAVSPIPARYCVTETHHVFNTVNGMRTGFAVQRPGLGSP